MTGGFVLGEVVILHQSTMKELAPLFAAALMLCVAAVCADRRRQVFWGRSLGVRLLPFMIILGLVRGLCEEQTVLAEQGLLLEESGTYAVGTVCGMKRIIWRRRETAGQQIIRSSRNRMDAGSVKWSGSGVSLHRFRRLPIRASLTMPHITGGRSWSGGYLRVHYRGQMKMDSESCMHLPI